MSDASIVLEAMTKNHRNMIDNAFYCGIRADLIHFVNISKIYTLHDGKEFAVLPEARFLAVYGCTRCTGDCCEPFPRCMPNRSLQSHPMALLLTHRVRLSEKLSNVFTEEEVVETGKKSRRDQSTYKTISAEDAYAITRRWREFVADLGETALLFRKKNHFCDSLIEDIKIVLDIPVRTDSDISCPLDVPASEPRPPSRLNCETSFLISMARFISPSHLSWGIDGIEGPNGCIHTQGVNFEHRDDMAYLARARWIPELMDNIARAVLERAFSLSSFQRGLGKPIATRPLLLFDPAHFISPEHILIRRNSKSIFLVENNGNHVPFFMPRLRPEETEIRVQERALFANAARVLAFIYTGEILSPTFEYTGTPSTVAVRISRFGDFLMPEYYELICKLARGTSSNHSEIDQLATAAFANHSRGLSLWQMSDPTPEDTMSKIEFTDIESAVVGVDLATKRWRDALLPPFDSWRGDTTLAIKPRVMKFREQGESGADILKRIVDSNRHIIAAESDLLAWNAYYSERLKHKDFPRDMPDLKFFGEIQMGLTPVRAFLLSVMKQYLDNKNPEPLLAYEESLGVLELRRGVQSVPDGEWYYHQAIVHIIKFFLVSPTTPPFICGPALLYAAAGLPYDATAISAATFFIDEKWHARIDCEPLESPFEMKKTYAESAYDAHRVAFEAVSRDRWCFTSEIEQRIPRFRRPDFLSMMCTGVSFLDFSTLQRNTLSLEDFQACLLVALAGSGYVHSNSFDDFLLHLRTNYDPEHFTFFEPFERKQLTLSELFFDVIDEQNEVCAKTRSLYLKAKLELVHAQQFGYLIRFILESNYARLYLVHKTLTDEERPSVALIIKARSASIRDWMVSYKTAMLTTANLGAETSKTRFVQTISSRVLLTNLTNHAAGHPFDIEVQAVTPNNWKPEHVSIPSVLTCSRKLLLRENSSYANFCLGMQTLLEQGNKFSMV